VAAAVTPAPATSAPPLKKGTKKSLLKGVVVKKNPKPKADEKPKGEGPDEKPKDTDSSDQRKDKGSDETRKDKDSNDKSKNGHNRENKDELPNAKRRKFSVSGPS
jgi:hypothetical protein